MPRRHKKKQQLQAHLEEVVETCHVKHAAQKVRKMAKVKAREEAEKWRLVKEKEKRK